MSFLDCYITPKSLVGKDDYKNLQILHRHCHDEKTTEDGSVVMYTIIEIEVTNSQ